MKLCVMQQNGLRGGISKKDIVRNLRFILNQDKHQNKFQTGIAKLNELPVHSIKAGARIGDRKHKELENIA